MRIADNKDMKNAKEFKGTCTEGTVINGVQYYSNKVTADGFEPNTTYYYQVKLMVNGNKLMNIKQATHIISHLCM